MIMIILLLLQVTLLGCYFTYLSQAPEVQDAQSQCVVVEFW